MEAELFAAIQRVQEAFGKYNAVKERLLTLESELNALSFEDIEALTNQLEDMNIDVNEEIRSLLQGAVDCWNECLDAQTHLRGVISKFQ